MTRTPRARSRFGRALLATAAIVVGVVGPMTPAYANNPAGSFLDCAPEADTNPVNTNHVVTCTLIDAAGDPVAAQPAAVTVNGEIDCLTLCAGATYDGQLDGDATDTPTDGDQPAVNPPVDDDDRTDPDGQCVIPQGSSACTFTYDRNDGGNDAITFWIGGHPSFVDEPAGEVDQDEFDTVLKNWEERVATTVDCGADQTNPTGDTHTTTCTTRDQFGQPIAGAPGPTVTNQAPAGNAGAPTCNGTTNAQGQGGCTFTNNGTPGTVTVTQCTGAGGTGTCDSMVKTFETPVATRLNVEPETATNQLPGDNQHTLTATVLDQFGTAINNQTVNFEFLAGSPSDTDGNTFASPDRACNTGAGNTCQLVYNNATAGTDTICGYVGVAPGTVTDTTCAGEAQAGDAAATNRFDVVTKTWAQAPPPANNNPVTQLDAEPETDSNPAGTVHTIRVQVRDANNNATAGAAPTQILADILPGSTNANTTTAQAEITCQPAADNPNTTIVENFACTYDDDGAGFGAASPGQDNIRVFADLNGNGIYDGANEPSDDVVKIWSGPANQVVVNPPSDTATSGTCNPFTATVTDAGGRPVSQATVDVIQTLRDAGTEAGETRELAFCDPTGVTGAGANIDPTPADITGNNAAGTAGQPGTNTTRHAEFGPTDSLGRITFGITMTPESAAGVVDLVVFVDDNNDSDTLTGAEPAGRATKNWVAGGANAVTGLDANPETDSNPNGTDHTITVALTGAGGPVANVRPTAQIISGPNQGAVVNCGVTNAAGNTTCTYTDAAAMPAGNSTDTIRVFVNQTNTSPITGGADAQEPQDDVTKTWTTPPTGLHIDLRCAGQGTANDFDAAAGDATAFPDNDPNGADCTNPLNDPNEVFTAIVTNTAGATGVGQAGIRVNFAIQSRSSTNGTSDDDIVLSTRECDTDASGRCSVTVTNPGPVNLDTVTVVATIAGQTVTDAGESNTDAATKQWQTAAVNPNGRLTLTPESATNQVGTPHTVVARVTDQFGDPVANANVDFRITSGPNAGLTGGLDRTTDSAGNVSFTYTSNAITTAITGPDVIVACTETGGSENDTCNAGEPTDTATKFWQTDPVVTDAVVLDMDAAQNGCNLVSTATGSDATATNAINVDVTGNQVGHTVCAAAFQGANRIAGAPITFTITGPGFFTRAVTGASNDVPTASKTITVTADQNGVASARITSTESGTATITATSGGRSDSGTKTFTTAPGNARTIELDPQTQNAALDTNAQLSAVVRDRFGNPVPGVVVTFTETGPAAFTTTNQVTTGPDGRADVQLRSEINGISTVVATISSGSGVNGTRGAGAADDECEELANNPVAGETAGNCTDTAEIRWGTASASPTASPTSPTAAPTVSPTGPAGPPTCTSGTPTTVQLAASHTRITAGNAPTLTGRVFNQAAAPCASTAVTIFAKQYGETGYTAVATVSTDANGQFSLVVRPTRQTSYGANVSPAIRSNVVNIRVHIRVNLGSPTTPSPANTARAVTNPVTFTGDLDPNFARVAVGLATLLDRNGASCFAITANCRFTVLQQTVTNGEGQFSITRTLRRGNGVYILFTSAHGGNDGGSKSILLNVTA